MGYNPETDTTEEVCNSDIPAIEAKNNALIAVEVILRDHGLDLADDIDTLRFNLANKIRRVCDENDWTYEASLPSPHVTLERLKSSKPVHWINAVAYADKKTCKIIGGIRSCWDKHEFASMEEAMGKLKDHAKHQIDEATAYVKGLKS